MFKVLQGDLCRARQSDNDEFALLESTLYDGNAGKWVKSGATLFVSLSPDSWMSGDLLTSDMIPRLGGWIVDLFLCRNGYSLINDANELGWSGEGFAVKDSESGDVIIYDEDHEVIEFEAEESSAIKSAIIGYANQTLESAHLSSLLGLDVICVTKCGA